MKRGGGAEFQYCDWSGPLKSGESGPSGAGYANKKFGAFKLANTALRRVSIISQQFSKYLALFTHKEEEHIIEENNSFNIYPSM